MDKDKCIVLIKLYESQRNLWDLTLPNHYNKQFRENSWKIISDKIGLPVEDVKKKMTALCGSFRREKSRHKQSLVAGSDVYISKWFAYDHFHFLGEKFIPRDTQNSMSTDVFSPTEIDITEPCENGESLKIKKEEEEEEEDPLHAETVSNGESADENKSFRETFSDKSTMYQEHPQPTTSRSNKKRKSTDTFQDNTVLDKAMKVLNYTDDSYDTFGKHIAAELRKYDPVTLAHVKKGIMDLIFQADISMQCRSSPVSRRPKWHQNNDFSPK